jgi:hypothetical protein
MCIIELRVLTIWVHAFEGAAVVAAPNGDVGTRNALAARRTVGCASPDAGTHHFQRPRVRGGVQSRHTLGLCTRIHCRWMASKERLVAGGG